MVRTETIDSKCVAEHMGGEHCVGRCLCPRDCSEAPKEKSVERIDETGWVIERGDSDAAQPKYWAAGQREAERSSAWTANHMQAIRFARKDDAERVAARIMKGIEVRICEHGWS